MDVQQLPAQERRGLAAFVRRFPQVHLAIGLLGNGLFVAGSVMFVVARQDVGVWLFLVGSCGMFLGAVGEAVRSLGRRWLRDQSQEQGQRSG